MAGTRDALDSMPPWDAATYFQQPTESVITLTGSTIQVVGGDPNRVAVMFCVSSSSVTISLNRGSGLNTGGILISTSTPPLLLLFSQVGSLCQQAWFTSGGLGGIITVYSISLYRWPDLAAAKVREAKRVSRPKPK